MRIDHRSFLSLKLPVGLGLLAFWNIGILWSVFPAGEFAPFETKASIYIGGGTAVATSLVLLAIATLAPIRDAAIHPRRRERFRRLDFLFVAGITFLIGTAWICMGLTGAFPK